MLDNLKKLNVGDESESIKVGEKFFYIKLLSFKDEYQLNLKDVYEDIMNTLTQLEIANFEMTEEIKNIDSYSTNQIFFSNSFNFLENIPDQYNFCLLYTSPSPRDDR